MANLCFQLINDAELLLYCSIQANSSREGFANITDGRIKICLRAQAIEGKANKALCAFLSTAFKCPKRDIDIIKGQNQKYKTILIKNPVNLPPEISHHEA